MPKTVTIPEKKVTVYQFDELSENAKEKAREWYRKVLGEVTDWSDSVTEDAANVGIEITAWDIGRGERCDIEFEHSAMDTAEAILREHGDQCDTYKAARDFKAVANEIGRKFTEGLIDESECDDAQSDAASEFEKELGGCYLKSLRDEYEYQFYGEGVDENILANEYEFTEDGA